MQPLPHSHEFAYGFRNAGPRLVGIVVLGVMLAVVTVCLGAFLSFAISSLIDRAVGGNATAVLVVSGVFIGLVAAGPVAWSVITFMAVLRMSARLDGTTLTVRERRARSVDLTRARTVLIRPTAKRMAGSGGFIHELVVTADNGHVRMRLSDGEGGPLPPHDLYVLAEALSRLRLPPASEAAKRLHWMAAGPSHTM